MITVDALITISLIAIPLLAAVAVMQVRRHFHSTKVGEFRPIDIEFVESDAVQEKTTQQTASETALTQNEQIDNAPAHAETSVSSAAQTVDESERVASQHRVPEAVTEKQSKETAEERPAEKQANFAEALSEELQAHAAANPVAPKKEHAEILNDYIGDFFTDAVDISPSPQKKRISPTHTPAAGKDSDIIELRHGDHMQFIRLRRK